MFKKLFVSVLALGIASGACASGKQEDFVQRRNHLYKAAYFSLVGGFSCPVIVSQYGLPIFAAPTVVAAVPLVCSGLSIYYCIKYFKPDASFRKWSNFKLNPFSSKKNS